METVTQRWAAVFVVLGIIIMLLNGLGFIHDPTPYLQFNLAIGTSFILGSGGAEIMRINKCEPLSRVQINEDSDRPRM